MNLRIFIFYNIRFKSELNRLMEINNHIAFPYSINNFYNLNIKVLPYLIEFVKSKYF